MATVEFKGVVKCIDGRRYFYLTICEMQYPRHWEAFISRSTDNVALDPREHHRIKVAGPMLDMLLSPEDIGRLIQGQIGPFLERNPEVWDLWRRRFGKPSRSARASLPDWREPHKRKRR